MYIDNGFPLVANIVAPPTNHPPGYPSDRTIYHYFTVIGYNAGNRSRGDCGWQVSPQVSSEMLG